MFAHLLIRTRERMDSSSEENEEEFFETLEDVASSSSDAESGEEEGQRMNKFESSISSASNAPGFSLTRYDVWKNTPGSILERKQRLFTRMGLKLEGEDSENSMDSVDATPMGPSTTAPPTADLNCERIDQGRRNAEYGDRGVPRKKSVNAPSASAGWTMVRSRSDGTFSSRLQNEENSEGSRLVRSGATTPVFYQGDQERLSDTSGAVLRTPSAPNHVPSKPPLGGKRGNGNGTSAAAEGMAARRLQFQWSKFGRFRVTDKNGNSLFDSTGSEVKATSKTSAGDLETLRFPLENGTLKTVDGDVLCRIKDLDSGKEFVVNEVGNDGMWNKLKELDTGREITLEEFESSLGLSPIVQEVMRRERASGDSNADEVQVDAGAGSQKRKMSWLKAMKGVVKGSREKGNRLQHGSGSDDRDASTEKSGRKSSSATDDSQDALPVSRPVKVHTHKKATKEFADLRLRQEIQAHQGAIWTMKFSLDGSYLATAGQDKVVRVWEVLLYNSRSNASPDSSGELNLGVEKLVEDSLFQSHGDAKKSSKCTLGRKTVTSRLPILFTLSENAKCAFKGHTEDILDLSWSPSQSLLSSSMDKTVRLWNVLSKVCLRIFAHNDYVTCVQFHPLDAGHFISGSLDGKVRIWNVRDPQVVDWVDLQEMVTAACYTPNGQGAVVGSYKGMCRFYKTSAGNKLQLDTTFEVRSNRAKRSHGKKITGFQFVPGDKQKLLITSSDSRIRIYDGTEISSKFTGFRNTKSHIAASFSTNGRFIICASEDSRVCVWNYDDSRHEYPGQQKRFSGSYEDFSAKHVLVAIPWPGRAIQRTSLSPTDSPMSKIPSLNLKRGVSMPISGSVSGGYSPESLSSTYFEAESVVTQEEASRHRGVPGDTSSSSPLGDNSPWVGSVSRGLSTLSDGQGTAFSDISSSSPSRSDSYRESCCGSALLSNCVSAQNIASNGFFGDSKGSATWPEEKLVSLQKNSLRNAANFNTISVSNKDVANGGEHISVSAVASAWGLVIVTAGLGGEIRIFQNYGLPVRL